MSSLNLYNENPESFVQISSGDDMDMDMNDEDAVVEISAFNMSGDYIPMHPYGYTWNLEEAKQLRDFLNDAIEAVEAANDN
ncbi:hypothetical protein CHOED_037 [Vibrio phage CHOED]|uniref:hypothetical protein n=1 Tax=Vibrio phage CHOED TaxID=1458716 RepID=UPI00042E71EC|nr:hypothetical protein CHOED_037 [Vibrio phage CHOED]AHK11897.1 hypothetical protein CHOED_037 [Vibrio phage CHOED]